MDRRNFMIGSGVAAAGAALLQSGFSIGRAQAASTGGQVPGYYKTKVGSIEVIALLDGGTQFSDDLMIDAKAEDLKDAKERNFIPAGNIFPGYVNGYLINTGSRLVLVDTGARGMGPAVGNILRNLQGAGVSPEQIDDVIITHAHPDHTNGLLDDSGMKVFSKANIRISRPEMDFWFDNSKKNSMPKKKEMFAAAQKNLGAYRNSGQIETFSMGDDIGNGISSVALPGHTPGHSGVRVSDGKEQLLIWADIVHVPALQFENPGISIAYDNDPVQAKKTRAKIFAETASDKIRVAGMHLCFPGIGHVTKRGAGYEFIPQMFETNV